MITIEQAKDFINTPEVLVAIGIGVLVIVIFSFLLRKKKEKFNFKEIMDKILEVNEHIQNSQKETIEAHKKLNEIYIVLKEGESSK